MTQQLTVNDIADKLNHSQRNVIISLDGQDFNMLGCAEETARRMCKDGVRRPALVERNRISGGPVFRLTELGVMVQEALGQMAWGERSR